VERVVVYAFPVVIAACAFEIEHLADTTRVSPRAIWGAILLAELGWWIPFASGTAAQVPLIYSAAFLTITGGIVMWTVYKRVISSPLAMVGRRTCV
jgi:hypothetical protein